MPGRRALVFVLFFASGFAGLVYQVLWMRELGTSGAMGTNLPNKGNAIPSRVVIDWLRASRRETKARSFPST